MCVAPKVITTILKYSQKKDVKKRDKWVQDDIEHSDRNMGFVFSFSFFRNITV